MTDLTVSADGVTRTFTPADAPVSVGRSRECDVRVDDPRVSRHHARLSCADGQWRYEDTSSRGSFVAGDAVTDLTIQGTTDVYVGARDGATITLAVGPPDPVDGGPRPTSDTTTIGDTALRLELDGRGLVFPATGRVTVGRSADNTVVVGEQHSLVSRHHVAFDWDGEGWTIEDLDSRRGTFLDGRPLRRGARAMGVFDLRLGDATAGTRLRVTTAGVHRHRRRIGLTVVLAGLAIAALVLGTWALVRTDGDGSAGGANSAPQQAAAREATVLVELLDGERERVGFRGSGVLVSDDGLILTNAHVAYPATHGERIGVTSEFADADRFAIGFASVDGGAVDRFYIAEPVALHPFHDAALLRIVADGDGDPAFELPFAPLPIGSIADLRAGDLIDQLGFPAVAGTLRVSVTTRNLQSVAPCPRTPGDDCLADLEDGWLNLSGQPLGGGSSGGPIVRDGVVVGLNQGAVFQTGRAVEQNRAIPIDLIVDELPFG